MLWPLAIDTPVATTFLATNEPGFPLPSEYTATMRSAPVMSQPWLKTSICTTSTVSPSEKSAGNDGRIEVAMMALVSPLRTLRMVGSRKAFMSQPGGLAWRVARKVLDAASVGVVAGSSPGEADAVANAVATRNTTSNAPVPRTRKCLVAVIETPSRRYGATPPTSPCGMDPTQSQTPVLMVAVLHTPGVVPISSPTAIPSPPCLNTPPNTWSPCATARTP